MATGQLVYAFQPTTPASTPVGSPYETNLVFPSLEVVEISWKVPPGPRGNLGWQLGVSGEAIVPANKDVYIVTDDEENTWGLVEQPTTGDWYFKAYNTGQYPHTVYLRFLCEPVTLQTTSSATLSLLDVASFGPALVPNVLVDVG
jgi:hypothetical protein